MQIGITGFGFMGQMHYGCWKQMPDVQVAAVCDCNPDIRKITGNIAGAADSIDLSGVTIYTDFDEMLRQERMDAVSITLPTYLHAEFTCKALEAGVNVLCEKPMALNAQQCQRMIDAAEKAGKYLMIAHCIRFWPEYVNAWNIVRSGQYGKVLAANFLRLSAKPLWNSEGWLMDSQRSGGVALDLHIHDTDYIQSLLGVPEGVYSRAIALDGVTGHIKTDYLYGEKMLISAEAGWLASASFKFKMSFVMLLEEATILYDSTKNPAYQIYPNTGVPFCPLLPKTDGYYAEIEYFLGRVQGQISEEKITVQQSCKSVEIIKAEEASCVSGKTVWLTHDGGTSDE